MFNVWSLLKILGFEIHPTALSQTTQKNLSGHSIDYLNASNIIEN